MASAYLPRSASMTLRLILARNMSAWQGKSERRAESPSSRFTFTLLSLKFSSAFRQAAGSISMPVTEAAPLCAAKIARIPVPVPISTTTEPSTLWLNRWRTIIEVVAWCPVPKAIFGSISMSYSAFGTSLWNVLWTTHLPSIRIGWK